MIANVSLPTGALTFPLHTVVQLTTVGVPALPPLGVTVTAADCVEGETYLGVRSALAVLAVGTTMLNATLTCCACCGCAGCGCGDDCLTTLGAVTPVGGLLLLAGWASLALAAFRLKAG